MKRILLSLLAIGAVAAVIGGATLAYFNDTAVSEDNTFTAGTLDFVIKDPTANNSRVFNVTSMKPGQTVTGYIMVANDGSMDMKWKAWLSGSGLLGEVLKVKVTLNPTGGPTVPTGYTNAGPPNHLITDFIPLSSLGDGNSILVWQSPAEAFAYHWAAVYKLEVKMDETANNTYQGASYTGDLNFFATQHENPGW